MSAAPFRSIVVATDFSVNAWHAVERALLLPLADDARLTLVHVVKSSLFASWGEAPAHDAEAELARLRASVEAAVPPGVRLSTCIRRGTPYAEVARAAREEEAELVVVGRTGRSPLRDHLLGTTAEQVVRNGNTSVLLVRNTRVAPYRRPLCAVDVGGAAAEVLRLARRVAAQVSGPVSVVHVYDAPFEGMFFPSLSAEALAEYRRSHRDRARTELTAELHANGIERASYRLAMRHGNARARIPAEAVSARADLLALGTHGHRGPAFALLGSVAGDVLRDVACDTLVVRTAGVAFSRP